LEKVRLSVVLALLASLKPEWKVAMQALGYSQADLARVLHFQRRIKERQR
jgi:hypothetical protein